MRIPLYRMLHAWRRGKAFRVETEILLKNSFWNYLLPNVGLRAIQVFVLLISVHHAFISGQIPRVWLRE